MYFQLRCVHLQRVLRALMPASILSIILLKLIINYLKLCVNVNPFVKLGYTNKLN